MLPCEDGGLAADERCLIPRTNGPVADARGSVLESNWSLTSLCENGHGSEEARRVGDSMLELFARSFGIVWTILSLP